jgi:hypothetical protein
LSEREKWRDKDTLFGDLLGFVRFSIIEREGEGEREKDTATEMCMGTYIYAQR